MPVGMGAGVGSGGTASAGHGAAGTGAAAAGAAAAGYASHNSAFSAAQGNKGSYGPNLPFQLKKVIVAAPPLASAATISDPTTSEDVQAGLRREAAAKRAPVTSTAQRSTGGSLGTSDSPTLKLLGSP